MCASNTATGNGGGIYNGSACAVTLTNSAVNQNSASDGGGIYNLGILTKDAATVVKNNTPNDIVG